MIFGKKIVCVLPSYNAEKTLEKTLRSVPPGIVDQYILVDDHSSDQTTQVGNLLKDEFPLKILSHEKNLGYGANQKTCYQAALEERADVVVMLHPDYQYEPKLLGCLASMVASGIYDVALGSRILGGGALKGGMPLYKYFFNRCLTFIENIMIGQKLSEYHTGYRAYSRLVLKSIAFDLNHNDFVFDNEILIQCHVQGFRIGEISIPTKYFPEASSITFWRSLRYGFGVLRCSFHGMLARFGIPLAPYLEPVRSV